MGRNSRGREQTNGHADARPEHRGGDARALIERARGVPERGGGRRDQRPAPVAVYLLKLESLLSEAKAAWDRGDEDAVDLILQVAGVALRCVDDHRARGGGPEPPEADRPLS